MSREIKINKYKGNTHYTVNVVDGYGQTHHIGYYKHIYTNINITCNQLHNI